MKKLQLVVIVFLSCLNATTQNFTISLENRWAEGPSLTSYTYQDYVYVGNGGRMDVLEINDLGNPELIGSVITSSVVQDIFVLDSLAYIASYNFGLQIINVSNPAQPEIIGAFDTYGTVLGIFATEGFCYLAERTGLRIVDVSDPASPQQVGFYQTTQFNFYVSNVSVVDHLAYIANSNGGLRILDLSDLDNITEVGHFDALHIRDVFIEDSYAYLASLLGGFYIVDISDPADPFEVFSSPSGYGSHSIIKRDNYIYTSGMSIWEASDVYNPVELGNWFSDDDSFEISLYNNFACLSSGSNGLEIIDISNPYDIHFVGVLNTSGSAQDVTVEDNIAYIADGSEGLQVIDISDPTNPSHIAQYFTDGYATQIMSSEGVVYLADYDYFRIIDVGNPYLPVEIGNYSGTFFTIIDMDVSGSFAYFGTYHGMLILDISDPSTPNEIGVYSPNFLNDCYAVCVSGQTAYIAVDDWSGINEVGVHIVNVSDASNPVMVGSWPHSDYIRDLKFQDDLLFILNNEAKLIIVDVSNPAQPLEVSFYEFDHQLTSIELIGQKAYLVPEETGDLIIADISNPNEINIISEFSNINHPSKNVFVSDTFAYMASTWSGFNILDITMAGQLAMVGQYETRGTSNDLFISDDYLFMANGKFGMSVFDLNDTINFNEIANFQFDGNALGVKVYDNYAFIDDYYNGLRILDIEDINNITQVGFYDDFLRKTDIQGNFAYLAQPGSGLKIVDISDISAPFEVGSVDLNGASWDLSVNGSYVYYADGQNGMNIIDVSNPFAPFQISQYCLINQSVYDVVAVDTIAYVAHGTAGLRILNVSNPADPQEISYYFAGDCISVRVENNLAYVAVPGYGLRIIDVTDPYDPVLFGEYPSGGQPSDAIPFQEHIYFSDGDDGIFNLKVNLITNIKVPNNKYNFKYIDLLQNTPNPFSKNTIIRYTVHQAIKISLVLYNHEGCKVKELENQFKPSGNYFFEIKNDDLPPGLYFYKLSCESETIVKKMMKI